MCSNTLLYTLYDLKTSEWLRSIYLTVWLITIGTDAGVKSDALTQIQGSSSVIMIAKHGRVAYTYVLQGGGSKLSGTKRRGQDERAGAEKRK